MNARRFSRIKGLKFALLAIVAISLTATVSACGRKGPLELPSEQSSN